MQNILLLEPSYKNKYPPLGLMKISAFHKYICKDFVYFSKGPLRDNAPKVTWDRIYVTTLFTFEWKKTIEMIEYAKTICSPDKIVVGGISSTLMANEFEKATGIKPVTGLLNRPGLLGYERDEEIDTITPDYSILENISEYYQYPYENAYFMYSTRGCGMNCGFCAVKTLEPNYVPYISIKDQIKKIDREYGPKKDLLLMDNNVLKSKYLKTIIDELIDLGYGKDAKYKNPKTGKNVNRYIDFNQGLDAFLMTDEKAKLLSKINIRPVRIAFDHIEDKDIYIKAIKHCAKNNIRTMSNYILYNAEAFTGKGHSYAADSPADLYERLRINIELTKEINQENPDKEPISIFSFPMRYIPLNDKKRGYIGSKWNKKYLRAIQAILIPTQGKVGTGDLFFYTSFGKDINDFHEILDMPEYVIGLRGLLIHNPNESEEEKNIRIKKYEYKSRIVNEWKQLYRSLSQSELTEFHSLILPNIYNKEMILNCKNKTIIKLLLYYISENEFKKLFTEFKNDPTSIQAETIIEYCTHIFPDVLDRVTNYLIKKSIYSYKEYPIYYYTKNILDKKIAEFHSISSSTKEYK